ncbi:hypothetical protein V8E54_005423 [Elaphomyces granulatus]
MSTYPTERAVYLELQSLPYSGLLYLRERRYKYHCRCLARTRDLQIQDNGNDLEEDGGDDFRATATVELATTATATVATMTATATAATTARTVAATAAATAATTQPRKRGHPKGSRDKELRKRGQKATGSGDTTATGN